MAGLLALVALYALPPSQVPVRIIYAAPSDLEFREDYSAAIRLATEDLKAWYATQLGGATFALSSPVPELCRMGKPEHYYQAGDTWGKVVTDTRHCALRLGKSAKVVYADITEACGGQTKLGQAVDGLTILHHADLEGLVDPDFLYCGGHWGGKNRTIGGLGHELGHALGLPHPPGCEDGLPSCPEDALMWHGFVDYPDTYLTVDEQDLLKDSQYIR